MENLTNMPNDSEENYEEYIPPEFDPNDPKYKLLGIMHGLSEYFYCAGWATWLEVDLWKAANYYNSKGYKWGTGRISRLKCRVLKSYSKQCGGWWIHGITSRKYYKKTKSDRVFVPLKEWEDLFKILDAKPRSLFDGSFIVTPR